MIIIYIQVLLSTDRLYFMTKYDINRKDKSIIYIRRLKPLIFQF